MEDRRAGPSLAQSDNSLNLTQHAGRIAHRQTIGGDRSRHNAARTNGAVASNANAGKNYRVRTNPHVIFDHNWYGRRHTTLFNAMLVSIYDPHVMSQQTMAPNFDLLICRNRRAVVDERLIACETISIGTTLPSRSPTIRLVIALLFAAPAAWAGYEVTLNLGHIGISSEWWREAFALVGAVVVGCTAWARVAILTTPVLSEGVDAGSAPSTLGPCLGSVTTDG